MPRRGKRIRVDRSIYRDARGHEVVARVGQARQSRYFALTASLKEMRRWRDDTVADLRADAQPTADVRTLAGAIAKYRKATNLPPDHADVPALNAWIAEHGALERRKLTPALAVQTFARWREAGYSAQSLYYRRLVILKVWRALDGPTVKTPVDNIIVTRPKGRRPVWVSNETIFEVLQELKKREFKGLPGRLRTPKTRARFMVLVTTGQRPAQLKRALPADVDLVRAVWHVRAAKGGEPIPVYLNSEMLDAWRLFFAAAAWGHYDTRSFARTLRHCGWPAGIRPYTVRHATGFTVSAAGGDLGDIQLMLGHTDPATTRVYVGAVESRMRGVSAKLEGRFRR